MTRVFAVVKLPRDRWGVRERYADGKLSRYPYPFKTYAEAKASATLSADVTDGYVELPEFPPC